MNIAGIDCATDPSRVGLALGVTDNTGLQLREVVPCARQNDVQGIVAEWICRSSPILLALDAPLGWPKMLGEALLDHKAGGQLDGRPEHLFARATDRFIGSKLKKSPLEIGANLIARTAHWALMLLRDLRERTGLDLPLLWQQGSSITTGVIEVYPAATLRSGYLPKLPRYSRSKDSKARGQIADWLECQIKIQDFRERLISSPHLIDAAVSVVAGDDFIASRCWPPEDYDLARQEGWIWVRRKDNT
jgi:predicted RNase H-like nuclease